MLIRAVHWVPTQNDILPRLAGVKNPTLLDAISSYHCLNLDEQYSYLTTFSCSFGRDRYMQLQLGVVPATDMFQKKTDELFHGIPNIFHIADNI